MVLLRGVPIPLADTFRLLGVDVAIGGSPVTGPVLSRRLEVGYSALRCLPHLATYDRRERPISTLVTPLALHGVAVASVTDSDLRGLGTAVLRAMWGATHLSRAKEIVFSVPTKGHRISPVMHTRYERLLWLTRVARKPGVTQVFTQAIWESGGRPPSWCSPKGWWCWDIPGQEYPLHLVQEPLRQVQNWVRDSLQLEAWCPVTFKRDAAPKATARVLSAWPDNPSAAYLGPASLRGRGALVSRSATTSTSRTGGEGGRPRAHP